MNVASGYTNLTESSQEPFLKKKMGKRWFFLFLVDYTSENMENFEFQLILIEWMDTDDTIHPKLI